MKAVVFDMDGVLFDTERLCRTGWCAVAGEFGIQDVEEFYPFCVGLNLADAGELAAKRYGKDFPYMEFRQKASEWYWDNVEKNGLPIMPGVKELLQFLKDGGYLLAVASSTRESSVRRNLEMTGLLSFFPVIVTGDMVAHSKPQPDIYLLACERLGVLPKEAYAIEDSPNGIRSSHAAGMKPIMVPDLLPADEEMRRLSFRIEDDLNAVREYFEKAKKALQ